MKVERTEASQLEGRKLTGVKGGRTKAFQLEGRKLPGVKVKGRKLPSWEEENSLV